MIRRHYISILVVLAAVICVSVISSVSATRNSKQEELDRMFPKAQPFTATAKFAGMDHVFHSNAGQIDSIRETFTLTTMHSPGPNDFNFTAGLAAGAWIGSLPAKGTVVRISSPTGYTKDMQIVEVETGKIYRPQPELLNYRTFRFNYEVTGPTGKVTHYGAIWEPVQSVADDVLVQDLRPGDTLRVWREDDKCSCSWHEFRKAAPDRF